MGIMDSIIFDAKVGNNVANPSTISNGVSILDNKFVPPGSVILDQEEADALPLRIGLFLRKHEQICASRG